VALSEFSFSRTSSPENRFSVRLFRTAIANAFRWPISTTSFLPRVMWGEDPIAHFVDCCDLLLCEMRVVLRHAGMGLYYAGRKHWVGNPDSALDLETIERATELSRDESFGEMDIVVTYDDPGCELVLPLQRKGEADEEQQGLAEDLRRAGYTVTGGH